MESAPIEQQPIPRLLALNPIKAFKWSFYVVLSLSAFTAVWMSTVVVVFDRIAHLQSASLAQAGGWVIAVMIAFTSLMYNRARAFKEDAPQHSFSLEAAELGLAATLFSVFSAAIAAAATYWFSTLGYGGVNGSQHLAITGMVALIPTALIFIAFMRFTEALAVLFTSSLRHPIKQSAPSTLRRLAAPSPWPKEVVFWRGCHAVRARLA